MRTTITIEDELFEQASLSVASKSASDNTNA